MGHKHKAGDHEAGRAERARDIGLFRYALIREPADPELTTRQRGVLVRQLAEMEHTGPDGEKVRVSRVSEGPVDPGLAHRRVRRPGPLGPARRAPHTGDGA